MALPKLKHAQFSYTLPMTKKKIHYRAYTVREEKILLIAMQSRETPDIIEAIKQVAENCVTEKIDTGALPIFDLEVLQLLLNIVSVSNIRTLSYRDIDTQEVKSFEVDLQAVLDENVKGLKPSSREISLNDEYAVTMKDVTIDMFLSKELDNLNDPVKMYDILGMMIEKVYSLKDDTDITYLKDCTKEEIVEFINSWDKKASEKVAAYFNDLPVIKKTLTYTNKDGVDREIKLSGVTDFFM